MPPVFLLGGGGDHPDRAATYGRFVRAATTDSGCRIVVIGVAPEPAEAQEAIESAEAALTAAATGAAVFELIGLARTGGQALSGAALAALEPTGIFVCGGLTPLYLDVLTRDPTCPAYLRQAGIPYAGLSAGAAVAATQAIVGGWQAARAGRVRPILFEGASEDRDLLDVRPGLGLVPFAVDVHASQWGTLTRAIHALDLGRVAEAWAIDEHTLLEVDGAGWSVHGAGQAYHLERDPAGGVRVTIHAPDESAPA